MPPHAPSDDAPDAHPDDDHDALRRRVAHLEQQVEALQHTVENLKQDVRTTKAEQARRSFRDHWKGWRAGLEKRVAIWSEENWTGRIGIGLMLLGVLLLFEYTVEQGWLGPSVRVAFGSMLGGGLLASGWRVYPDRSRLGGLLLGGSSATFYATVFAAHQLYALLPYAFAFASMATITVVTVALALRHDDAGLSVAGAAGGLATPFLLYGDTESIVGLVAYVLLLLSGMSAVYLYRGWRSLLYTLVGGGWLVLLVGGLDTALSSFFGSDVPLRDRIALQTGMVGAWLLLGGLPVLRPLLRRASPTQWPLPAFPFGSRLKRWLVERPRYLLVTASPLLAMAGTRLLWRNVPPEIWALLAVSGAVLYAILYIRLARVPLPRDAQAHAIVAAVLLAYAMGDVLDGPALLLAWSVEVLALHAAARSFDDAVLRRSGHALAGLVVLWMGSRLDLDPAGASFWESGAVLEVGVLGLGLLAARVLPSFGVARLYRGMAWGGWLAWAWHQFVPLPNGHAYTSALWGATALIMLIVSWRRPAPWLQRGALATLVLFVGKLLLIDLVQLSALWRILLFLTSGGVLLLVSYALPDEESR